jgi:death on curing protein
MPDKTEPEWICLNAVFAIHDEQLAEHGGSASIRDQGLLESALSRAQNLYAYSDPEPDIAALAACYAYGIAKNHGFVDGNKRTSRVVTRTFLMLNGGYSIAADKAEQVKVWLDLADGTMSEEAFTAWLRTVMTNRC